MANNDILQYLRETPHNTNVNVVKGMIGNGNGSGSDSNKVTIYEGEITTTTIFSSMSGTANAAPIPSKMLISNVNSQVYINFDGIDYVLPKSSQSTATYSTYFGSDDRNTANYPYFPSDASFPCGISIGDGYYGSIRDALYTPEPGTYLVKIEIEE